ncbi:HbrB-like protein [Aureobasidium pullulans]|uniref:HbrB-like protein n=1 Tax=Aureobasidium pullulans TaxID=5580 RepID=A0A4S9Y2T4_AURPU|nr:HbrB-like protein [Aureobasidium pullulans]
MNNNNHHPPLRPRPRQRSPSGSGSGSGTGTGSGTLSSHRSASSMSAATNDSSTKHQPPQQQYSARPSTAHSTTAPSALANFSRPQPRQSIDAQLRMTSPPPPPPSAPPSILQRGRQHSQGFFEPSLPHTSHMPASQIAAQAAMHHMHSANQDRKRPNPPLQPINVAASRMDRRIASPTTLSPPPQQSCHIDSRITATTAANVAFPRSPGSMPSPHALTADQPVSAPPPPTPSEVKVKERSKMKLFHKPKSIGITKDKDFDKKAAPALPSPNRGLLRAGFASASMTSLTDPNSSAAASVYSSANTSTSTLVPVTTTATATADKKEDKEKHRHHFLSRQKQKDRGALPLSSASSNSTAVDPNAPQSLYSFTPQSPGFSKSVSGLDLRHGGRALREKKKEEKAAAAAATNLTPIMSNSSGNLLRDDSRSDFMGPSSLDSTSILGPPSSNSLFSLPLYEPQPTMSAAAFNNLGNSMGLHGITADDAWPLLKARLLNIFSGEDLRTPIEDFNLLVSVHIRRCIQKRAPVVLVEDLRELLATGFSSLAQTLRGVPDERLVTRLVAIWQTTFSSILPFIQAVFLPLDLEFRGRGSIMSAREAQEFWGAFVPAEMPPPFFRKHSSSFDEIRPSSSGGATITSNTSNRMPGLGEELDVRRIALIVFRDVVLLPRHESLLAIFSRLSLDSINTAPAPNNLSSSPPISSNRGRGFSNPAAGGAERPSTGGSLSPRLGSSFNSNTNYLDNNNNGVIGSPPPQHTRSRATSNTSAGSFGTSLPHTSSHYPAASIDSVTSAPAFSSSFSPDPSGRPPTFADPAQVTQTVARMLQCVSVVAGAQTGDQSQSMVERLTRELKYNWLGRGRTGRQRRGWVGVKGKNTSGMGQGQGLGVNGLGVVGA